METIAIIGTGRMGKGLAKIFAENTAHRIILGSRDANRAQSIAAELHENITGMDYLAASKEGDLVILAIPFEENNPLLQEMRPNLANKIVVDISNALTSDFSALTTPPDSSASEIIASEMPEARLVAAFKNTNFRIFDSPLFDGVKSHVFVAGNDQMAKAHVMDLINQLPFEAVDAGDLTSARTLENMTVLLGKIAAIKKLNRVAAYRVLF